MFTYRCPSCGKQHVADKEPGEGFTATCLRCRGAIQVPGPALAAAGAVPARRPPAEEAPADEDAAAEAARADPRKQAITRQPAQGKEGKPPSKKVKKIVKEPEAEEEDAALPAPPEEPKKEPPGPKLAPKPPAKEGLGSRNKIIAGVLALVLVGGGVGAYFLFSGKKEAPKKASKTAGKKPAPAKDKKTPPKPAAKDKDKDKNQKDKKLTPPPQAEPVFKPQNFKVFHLSAARLSAELADDLANTNAKYFGATLEVTGVFARLEPKEPVKGPARPHAVFAADGPAVYADPLGGPTPEKDWKALAPGKVITVRGAYSREGFLHGCELLKEPAAPADARYKGKEMELAGFVSSLDTGDFPTLKLERETNGLLDVACLFPKSEAAEVKKLKPGDPVVVHGTCNGRKGKLVRLDNCKLVFTTAPEGQASRLKVVPFLRDYEEDLFPALRPPPGEEERVEKEFTVRDLHRELAGHPKAWEKYRGKLLTVTGPVRSRDKAKSTLTLGFEDTDKSFNVLCAFLLSQFGDLDDDDSFRIRGLCTGMTDKQTLRLDNCQVDRPATPDDGRRLTAGFLPHTPGQNLTYDVSAFQELSETATFIRLVCLQGENGVTTTTRTHSALMSGVSLFEPGIDKRWVKYRKTLKGKPLPGPTFVRRVRGRYVEAGEVLPGKQGKAEVSWEPVLKIGARVGDSWTWTDKNVSHSYKLLKFGEYKGRRSATVFEVLRSPLTVHPIEVRHLYVEGVGEVERQGVLRISPTSTRILSEKRLIEDDSPMPAKPPKPPTKKEG